MPYFKKSHISRKALLNLLPKIAVTYASPEFFLEMTIVTEWSRNHSSNSDED